MGIGKKDMGHFKDEIISSCIASSSPPDRTYVAWVNDNYWPERLYPVIVPLYPWHVWFFSLASIKYAITSLSLACTCMYAQGIINQSDIKQQPKQYILWWTHGIWQAAWFQKRRNWGNAQLRRHPWVMLK
jgi:hypothetical protein